MSPAPTNPLDTAAEHLRAAMSRDTDPVMAALHLARARNVIDSVKEDARRLEILVSAREKEFARVNAEKREVAS